MQRILRLGVIPALQPQYQNYVILVFVLILRYTEIILIGSNSI